MTIYIKKAQSGRSMIEMLGVLAIVGVLSAGGIAGYSMAMQSYKTSALTEKVNLIAQQARVLYNGIYKSGTGESAVSISAAKLISAGMITDANNPFGGDLTVAPSSDGTEFTVATTANVPAEACIKLLRTDWGTTGVFTSVKAGSDEYCSATGTGEGACTTKSPATAAQAISSCDGGNITMEWKFK